MTRTEIEAMKYIGEGYDDALSGPIPDTRWRMYQWCQDGMCYAVLNAAEKFKKGNTAAGIAWGGWEDLTP